MQSKRGHQQIAHRAKGYRSLYILASMSFSKDLIRSLNNRKIANEACDNWVSCVFAHRAKAIAVYTIRKFKLYNCKHQLSATTIVSSCGFNNR
jgi:hypothetical protein